MPVSRRLPGYCRKLVILCSFCLCSGASGAQYDELALKSQRGKEALEGGRFEEAVSIYKDLVRAVPDNPGLLMNLGMAHHMAGRPQEAIAQFKAALKIQPDFLQAQLLLGAASLEAGDTGQAVRALEQVVRAQPEHKDARMMLADALLSSQRYREAARHFQKLTSQDPDSPRLWYQLGRSYELLSQQLFEELQRIAPESPYWFSLIGDVLLRQQKYSNAFYFYRQALERQPNLRGVHEALAQVYRNTGHPDWARIENQREKEVPASDCQNQTVECEFRAGRYHQVLELAADQHGPEAYYWQVLACNRLALEALSRLGELPPSPEAHELKAEIHFNQGQYQESVQELRKALQMARRSPALEKQLAEALYFSREYQDAARLLEKLLAEDSDAPELNFLYGNTLLQLQRVEEAARFLKSALASSPNLLEAHSSLARAYLQLEQFESAIPHLEKALTIDEDGSLHYQLAQAYQRTGRMEQAREMLQKYQEIQKTRKAETAKLEQEIQITPP